MVLNGNIKKIMNKITKKTTVREILQQVGTEFGRNFSPNIWVNALFANYDRKFSIEELKRLNSIWKNINTRCTNVKYEKYHLYGGKGIVNEWVNFKDFLKWCETSGYNNNLTLDRINSDENYNNFNCRWVTPALQAFNQGTYKNSKSGIRGVSQKSKRIGKYNKTWVAQIQSEGKKEHLGYFKTKEEAEKIYLEEYHKIEKDLISKSEKLHFKNHCWIISDVRFRNEAQAIKDRGGILIRTIRESDYKSDHPSETSLDNWKEWDYVIDNNGSMEDLQEKVKTILNNVYGKSNS